MAANSLTFADVPAGFFSTAVVPYDLSIGSVLRTATVTHLSNKYCSHDELADFCRTPFDGFIVS